MGQCFFSETDGKNKQPDNFCNRARFFVASLFFCAAAKRLNKKQQYYAQAVSTTAFSFGVFFYFYALQKNI
jgi:hypothetical protein